MSPQGAPQASRRIVEIFGSGGVIGVAEVEIVRFPNRHDVDVHVGHLETENRRPDLHGLPFVLDGATHAVGHVGQVLHRGAGEIEPVVHFLPGYHQRMAGLEGSHGKESHAALVAPNESRGKFSVNDAAENGCHAGPPGGGKRLHSGSSVYPKPTRLRGTVSAEKERRATVRLLPQKKRARPPLPETALADFASARKEQPP